jgi:hypothetical protein
MVGDKSVKILEAVEKLIAGNNRYVNENKNNAISSIIFSPLYFFYSVKLKKRLCVGSSVVLKKRSR